MSAKDTWKNHYYSTRPLFEYFVSAVLAFELGKGAFSFLNIVWKQFCIFNNYDFNHSLIYTYSLWVPNPAIPNQSWVLSLSLYQIRGLHVITIQVLLAYTMYSYTHDQEEWVRCRPYCFWDIGKNSVQIPLLYIVFNIDKFFITL